MKRFLGLALSQGAALSMVLVGLLPVNAEASAKSNCCEDECCDTGCGSNVWCWLGGAALGAAAGAATGAAVADGKRGHRGEIGPVGPIGPMGLPGVAGPTGPTGPAGTFPIDVDETLTFNIGFDVTAGIGATVTPFVAQPDGTVLEGTPVVIAGLGLIAFPPFVIQDPEFGEYNAGIQVDATLIAVTGTLEENAVATRDSSTTVFGNLISVGVAIATQEQINADFVYGETNVP